MRSGQGKSIQVHVQAEKANDTSCMQRTEKVIPHCHSNPNESGCSMLWPELYAAAVTRSAGAKISLESNNEQSW